MPMFKENKKLITIPFRYAYRKLLIEQPGKEIGLPNIPQTVKTISKHFLLSAPFFSVFT